MSANILNWHAKAGRGLGIGAIDYTPARVGQTLHIPCSRGHRVDVEIKTRMAPETLGKKLLNAGWTIGNHLLCPKHSKKPKAPEAPQQETEDMPVVEAVKMPPSSVSPFPVQAAAPAAPLVSTDAARTAKRAAMQWLDEAFDVGKGTYSPGVTDETIAKETGLAAAKVKELREEFYGALKEPSELGAAREQIEKVRKDAMLRIGEIQSAAVAVQENAKRAIGDIVRDLDNAVLRIENLAKLNGWRS